MYSEKDIANMNDIRNFLETNDIEYSTAYDNFCLNYNHPEGKRMYEIEYVPSHLYPVAYSQYNIKGVPADYFYVKSYKAEHEDNSFKCWVKDFEWEDNRKREVLKSLFLYAAGKIKNTFYARECEVRVVSPKVGRDFESEHCFYGKRGASLSLGLYTKKEKHGVPVNTLIMIYTFGKNFFGQDDSIEVLRVGTKKFCNVVGGASKLLSYFIDYYPTISIGSQEIPVKVLKFYSDYDHNIGSSLNSLGFQFVNYSKGGFMNYWLEAGTVKSRQPNKHHWVMEQMKLGKVLSIPNAGVKTFIMNIDRTNRPVKERPQIEVEKNVVDILF